MFRKSIVVLFGFAAILSSAQNARADIVATTTISFDPILVASDAIDSLVIDWSTPMMSGIVDESGLSTLTFSVFNGNALVYRDIAIQNGVAQPIGDVARGTDDFQFHFDIDARRFVLPGNGAGSWDNDLLVLQRGNTSGTTWNIYSDPEEQLAYFDKLIDGSYVDREEIEFNQSTVYAVPEPSSAALLATVGVGFFITRRRR